MTRQFTMHVPQFKWKTDPASWVRYSLFPQRDVEEPEDLKMLSEDQEAFVRDVERHVTDYLQSNMPYYNSICVVLAASALHFAVQSDKDDLGCWTWAGDKNSLFNRLLERGIGALEYMRHVQCQETKIDPSLIVVSMEAHCRKYGMRRFRSPAGDGKDIAFSYDPIDNPVFDNHKYIPSSVGYYTIIGTGSARD